MFKTTNRTDWLLYLVVDIILLCAVFVGIFKLKYHGVGIADFNKYVLIFILWGIFIVLSLKIKNMYCTDRNLTIPREFFIVFHSLLYSSVMIAALIFLLKFKYFSRFVFILSFISLVIFLGGWRILKRMLLRKLISAGYNNFNVLIIGMGSISTLLCDTINKYPYLGLKVIGGINDFTKGSKATSIPILGKIENFEEICKRFFVDEVFITVALPHALFQEILNISKKMHIGIRVIPENIEEPVPLVDTNTLEFIPILTYKDRRPHPAELTLKRIFDIVVSAALLILLSPVFIILSMLIKRDSPGKVFYVQKRMGKKGYIFNFYKFRSMVKGADELKEDLLGQNEIKDGVIFKIKDDPRITRIGRFLRKYSLDELPQFFNVLLGDMSMVGPRPFPVEESQKFEYDQIPRLNIRPGITGLSQVKGRSDLTFKKWAKWDLWYVNNWSFGLDIKILLWTIPAVLKGKGAY